MRPADHAERRGYAAIGGADTVMDGGGGAGAGAGTHDAFLRALGTGARGARDAVLPVKILFSIERFALYSYGLDFHSRVLLCRSTTGCTATTRARARPTCFWPS